MINPVSFLPSALMLCLASLSDVKTRKVSGKTFFGGALLGISLNAIYWIWSGDLPTAQGWVLALVVIVMATSLKVVPGIGGADKIAIALTALLNPYAVFLCLFLGGLILVTSLAFYLGVEGKVPYIPLIAFAFFIAAAFG